MKIYNTLTRRKEEFVPIEEGKVKMYVCGPTVYNFFHIGNARPFVVFDTLRKYLEYRGYKVKFIQNFTDVDDKIINRAKEEGVTAPEVSEKYIEEYYKDAAALNVKRATVHPQVSKTMDEIIEFVQDLIDKGYAYESDGDVYYRTRKFDGYGKLSGKNIEDLIAGARIAVGEKKEDPLDFALWKARKEDSEIAWESPWGMGRPGWHIECSAMAKKYLGETIDIHAGGADLQFPHHENEIAQSECWLDKKCVNYWMHGEFMLFDGGKMSKSLGNCYLLSQLNEMGYSAMDFRYFCLNTHYRQKLNFTFDTLAASKTAYNRLLTLLRQHFDSDVRTEESVLKAFDDEFNAAISDDLNVPMALGVLWKMLKLPKSKDVCLLAQKWDAVFGLNLDKLPQPEKQQVNAPQEVIDLAEERLVARKNKDWAKSDELRAKIKASGYDVKDTATGYELSKS